jgi:hypothetical protein
MKKIILVLAIPFMMVSNVANAQSGFTITDKVALGSGDSLAGVYMEGSFHMANMLNTGAIPIDLSSWRGLSYKTNGFDKTAPRVGGKDVITAAINVVPTDIISIGVDTVRMSDVVAFMYEKLMTELATLYGWEIER